MNVPDRKYLSEFTVNLFTARFLMVTPDELTSGFAVPQEGKEIAERCHIYLICRVPGSSFDPDSFVFDGTHVQGKLVYKIDGTPTSITFQFSFELMDDAVNVELDSYPHREFYAVTAGGERVRRVPAYAVGFSPIVTAEVLHRLEVLYVGQAYAEGKRTAFDRYAATQRFRKFWLKFTIDRLMINSSF